MRQCDYGVLLPTFHKGRHALLGDDQGCTVPRALYVAVTMEVVRDGPMQAW